LIAPTISLATSNHQIIQAELEAAVGKILEANMTQHLFKRLDRNAPLVLIALHFVTYQVNDMQQVQDRIDNV